MPYPDHTPPEVVDAIQTIAAYLRAGQYSDCLITPGGGASFSRGPNHMERLDALYQALSDNAPDATQPTLALDAPEWLQTDADALLDDLARFIEG